MLEHTKHRYYVDLVYCPLKKAYETFRALHGDEEPGGEACDGCDELFEVKELAEVSA